MAVRALRSLFPAVWVVVATAFASVSKGTAQTHASNAESFESGVRPLLQEYCLKCHSTEQPKGDLDLERFSSFREVLKHPKVWERVIEQLSLGEMPPKAKPQPTKAERERLVSWVNRALDEAAQVNAGDPGPVVLRRLNNAEYTYTVRDLTGVASLNPAKEFPVDSAAGEGFMNTGNALVMSPALITKYLDAGKDIASHAVLLPDGLRFSSGTTRRDWTEEILTEIRRFYQSFTEPGGAETVTQQGMELDKNKGGRLPLEKYLTATLELRSDARRLPALARQNNLSPKYLAELLTLLNRPEPSLLLDPVRARWRTATSADVAALAAEIEQWQKVLWKFSSVGHIGKVGGPKAWMEPVSPLRPRHEVRFKLAAPTSGNEVVIYLVASDAGDSNTNDFVLWQQPKLVVPGQSDLLLRDVRDLTRELTARREKLFAVTAKCLTAVAEASASTNQLDIAELARRNGVEADALGAWLDYLGIGSGSDLKLDHFNQQMKKVSDYDFVNGWGSGETPLLVANSSDQPVRIPGNLKPHGVTVHPSPQLSAAVGWRSPLAGPMRIEAKVTHAHPECGNGVTWSLELRRGVTRQRLANGTAQGSKEVKVDFAENITVQRGDLVSLLIGSREGNHSCDLTDIELVLRSVGEGGREWSLTRDVSPDVLAGNPHADRFGNDGVWHFYTEPVSGRETGPVIPAGSLLARWLSAEPAEEKFKLAQAVQTLLTSSPPEAKDSPDAKLHQQLASLSGPLFKNQRGGSRREETNSKGQNRQSLLTSAATNTVGLDPASFGRHPNGTAIEASSLCVQAPSLVEIRLPADLVAGAEFVTTGVLDPKSGAEGSVQLQALTRKPTDIKALLPGASTSQNKKGTWTDPDQPVGHSTPIVIVEGSATARRIESNLNEFRRWFPAALCYTKIVPVDEVVTLTLLYREDDQLARLMLDEAQNNRLDQLWNELHYVSQDALTLVDAFEQLWQYATQDADPKVFEPMRQPINDRAAAFRQLLTNTQPQHLKGVLEFAGRAYRRPLTAAEQDELRELYGKLRSEDLPHDEAIRLVLARVFVAPAFLYRLEQAAPGKTPAPVSDWELANRLSYFLWSSLPDAELRGVAAAGKLHQPDVLVAQARRMLPDPRVRRLATEFACAWLHIHDFESLDEKSERHFPTFARLRGPMYEEAIRFFTDVFQNDGSVLELFDTDHTFLNEDLAQHYGIPGVTGPEWRRVDNVKAHGRGGILGLGATLAKQSGASRTSPILRGNWVAEVLLGDKLPPPPKEVPRLPEDEATETLTVRQLTEKHSRDPRCAGCHALIDGYGFALEGYDPIGRARTRDLADRPIDTRATLIDGTPVDGAADLRHYLLTKKREAVLRQFCRKLLGYALGRGVILSDKPLITEMQRQLAAHNYRFSAAVETIVRSKQFREIRGRDTGSED
ncbi:MAG: DUF1592 domain-containing protein [Verrucomicrobia subdivision 3 bacterium]|nr:DUF1592 domain-containing protein [Limisphaerales bacterium]